MRSERGWGVPGPPGSGGTREAPGATGPPPRGGAPGPAAPPSGTRGAPAPARPAESRPGARPTAGASLHPAPRIPPRASPNKGRPDRETPERRSGPRYRLGALREEPEQLGPAAARVPSCLVQTHRADREGLRRRGQPPPQHSPAAPSHHPSPRGERSSVPAARSAAPPGRAEPLSAAWDRVCRRRPPTVARSAAPSGPPHLRPEPLRYLAAPDAPRRRRPAGAAPGARGSPVPPWCRRCRRCDAERGGAGWRTGEGPAGPARRKQRAVNHRTHPGDTGGRPAAAPAPEGAACPCRRGALGPGFRGPPGTASPGAAPAHSSGSPGGQAGGLGPPQQRRSIPARESGTGAGMPHAAEPPCRQSPGAGPYRRGMLGPLSRSRGAPAKAGGRPTASRPCLQLFPRCHNNGLSPASGLPQLRAPGPAAGQRSRVTRGCGRWRGAVRSRTRGVFALPMPAGSLPSCCPWRRAGGAGMSGAGPSRVNSAELG